MPQVQRVKQMASEPRINPRKGVVRQSGVGKDYDSRNQGVQNVCGTGGSSNPFYSIGLFSFHFSSTLGKRWQKGIATMVYGIDFGRHHFYKQ